MASRKHSRVADIINRRHGEDEGRGEKPYLTQLDCEGSTEVELELTFYDANGREIE